LTSEWNPRKRRAFWARERPLRANGPVSEKSAAARPRAMKRKLDKPVTGELVGYTHGNPKCDAQYRACR